jgi:hypothetical protein
VAKCGPAHNAHDIWRKSTASGASECVEVAFVEQSVLVRHSQDPTGPTLTFSRPEWAAFVAGVRNGEFDPESSLLGPGATGADAVRYRVDGPDPVDG